MRSVTCWFYYLITLVYMVTLCYKIVSAKHAKLISPFEGYKKCQFDRLCLLCLMSSMVFQKSPQKTKARVDAVFFRQLRHLLSVVIPGPFSGEVGFLFLVALALIARSVCDLWLIHTSTYIEK